MFTVYCKSSVSCFSSRFIEGKRSTCVSNCLSNRSGSCLSVSLEKMGSRDSGYTKDTEA